MALCTAVVGATKSSSFIKGILNMYDTGRYETEKTVIDGEKYIDVYKDAFSVPNNGLWTWYLIKKNPSFRLNNREQHLGNITVYSKEYFETGSIFGKWYTRHLNSNLRKQKSEVNDSLWNWMKNRMKKNQPLWTICRKLKFRKAQKSTSFYRNRSEVRK